MVGIPILTLVPGELGGSEIYVRELLRGLGRVGGQSYLVLAPPGAPDASEGLPCELATEYGSARSLPGRLAAMTGATLRPGPLRARLAATQVVHYPLTLRVPTIDRPSIVTLHDVQHLDLPGMFPRAERLFRAVAWQRSVLGAERVIVISEFVRDRAIEKLGVRPERIRVVHSGVDHERHDAGRRAARAVRLLPGARVAAQEPRASLRGVRARCAGERPELRLVLSGGGRFDDLPDGAEALGFVSTERARAALSHGLRARLPVALRRLRAAARSRRWRAAARSPAANEASLPEIAGDAARLFDPRDPAAIADAVLEVLDDPEPWSKRGLARAAEFSWDATARATDAVYAELL